MTDALLYRIARRADWDAAQEAGVYRGGAHDARDGFLHLSTRAQVPGTLAAHYRGQRDLVVLEIDAAALASGIKFEPSRNGELFPHLYGVLPVRAVRSVLAVPPDGAPFAPEAA